MLDAGCGMFGTAERIVTGKIVHGRGNELSVRDVLEIDGEKPTERTVVKEPNAYFFGWQTPRYEGMEEYLEALQEYGFRLRESLRLLQLSEGAEITRVRNCTRGELLKNILFDQLTIGSILKFLTKQWGRKSDFVLTEEYSEEPCMKWSDMGHEKWGPLLCELLDKCEQLHDDRDLMADPLGGAAIIGALKFLFDPRFEPILSNLEKSEDGEIILADPGLMNVGQGGERVSNIPGTRWAMAVSLRFLGELGFEAMNMALRDRGHDIKTRDWGLSNAIPKIVAWAGFNTVRGAREFWVSKWSDYSLAFRDSISCLG